MGSKISPAALSARDIKLVPLHLTYYCTFSLVTSKQNFIVGGLSGSLFTNLITDKWGRRGAKRISAKLSSLRLVQPSWVSATLFPYSWSVAK